MPFPGYEIIISRTVVLVRTSKNLVCNTTVYYNASSVSLVSRVTSLVSTNKSLLARVTSRKVATRSLVCRTSVFYNEVSKNLISKISVPNRTNSLIFTIPVEPDNQNWHFHIKTLQSDGSTIVNEYESKNSVGNWFYWNSGWTAFPSVGVPLAFYGDVAKLRIPLTPVEVKWAVRGWDGYEYTAWSTVADIEEKIKNLTVRVTSLISTSVTLVSRVTSLVKSSKSLVARTSVIYATNLNNLLARMTIRVKTSSNLRCRVTCNGVSWAQTADNETSWCEDLTCSEIVT